MGTKYQYKRLDNNNFTGYSLDDFVRHQTVTECWRKIAGDWKLVPNAYEENWSQVQCREITEDVVKGKPLPYLPFAYRHPEYWQKIVEESKAGGDKVASRKMFDESERRHPVREEEKIKVENIHGKIVLVGAEDDVLWDTCKYIRRMEERLSGLPHECRWKALLYEHGTHFVFPESLLKRILPVGSDLLVRFMFKAGREYPENRS